MTDLQVQQLLEAIKPKPWYDTSYMIGYAMYSIVGWTFWKITRSIDDLYKKYNDTSAEVNNLQGQHDAFTGKGAHPCRRYSDIDKE